MKENPFGCKFSVIAMPRRSDVFLMNMRVYDVVPHRLEASTSNDPLSVVWCAVYQTKEPQLGLS
jgi:hypothetical protein